MIPWVILAIIAAFMVGGSCGLFAFALLRIGRDERG